MRLRKVRWIAGFELYRAVTRPAYIALTLGLPLFFGLVGGVPAYLQRSQIDAELSRPVLYAAVDEAGMLFLSLRQRPASELDPRVRARLPDVPDDTPLVVHQTVAFWPLEAEAARRALEAGTVEGVIIVPRDYLREGRIAMVRRTRASPLDVSAETAEQHVRSLLVQGLLYRQVEPSLAERVRTPITELVSLRPGPGGALVPTGDEAMSTVARMLVPVALSMLLLMALMTTGGYLVQGIGDEKENRVIEVLLATVRPTEILAGKLLGLGAAGLVQFGVWALGFLFTVGGVLGLIDDLAVDVPWRAVAVAPVLFVFGYLFYGSLMLSTGSLGNTSSESQKLTMLWGMLALLPMLFLPVFLQSPHGLGALLMHWIPFTAPLAVVLRLAQDPDGVETWEVVGSVGVLIVCTWLSVRIGARLFRVGIMLGGGWPGWRQVLRQAEIA